MRASTDTFPAVDKSSSSLGAVAGKKSHAGPLVSLPNLEPRLLELVWCTGQRQVDLHRVSELLRGEKSLCERVVRFARANLRKEGSGAAGEPGGHFALPSVEEAVLHLGAERLSILVLAEALTRYSAQILSPAEQRTFWRHSVLVALLSSQIARFTGLVSPHQAYLAGLVHAIGLIPLALLGRNTALLEIPAPTGTDISPLQRERNTWGLDHCEAGRLLAEAWNLQPELAEVCAHHHDPAKARRAPELTGVVAAAVAASLLHDAAGGCLANLVEQASHGETRSFDELLEASLPALGSFDRARLRELLEEDLLHNVTWMDCISGVSPNLMRQDADRPNRIP